MIWVLKFVSVSTSVCSLTRFLNYTAQKMKFSIKDFFSKCDQIRRKILQFPADLIPFTEKALNGKLYYLRSVSLTMRFRCVFRILPNIEVGFFANIANDFHPFNFFARSPLFHVWLDPKCASETRLNISMLNKSLLPTARVRVRLRHLKKIISSLLPITSLW